MRTGLRALLMVALFSALLPMLGARAQDQITLEPYTSIDHAFTSVRPAGWQEIGPGSFSPDASGQVVLAQQSTPISPDAVLDSLLTQLLLTERPVSTGEYAASSLNWTLYQVEVPFGSVTFVVDMAMTTQGSTTFLVVLQSTPAESAALREQVFLPALDAFTPIAAAPPADLPYTSEDVTFTSGDITLAGTLTLPPGDGPFPGVALVTGSGPQDRDESAGGIAMKPFALLADGLTREGIAVLRYDDRGAGESGGDFAAATLADFANDAEAAVTYLTTRPEVNPEQIGLLGHSEGGVVAAILGARNHDLDFIISLAGLGVPGDEVLLLQNRRLLEAEGADPAAIETQVALVSQMIAARDDPAAVEAIAYAAALTQLQALPAEQQQGLGDLDALARTKARQQAVQFTSASFRALLDYDPAPDWAKTTAPVLAIFGGKDRQVDAAQNAAPLLSALTTGGNMNVTVVILPDANHLFQAAGTGGFSEYTTLPPEFTPDLIPVITDWIARQTTLTPAAATPVAGTPVAGG
ncbi:MAG: alpha/beta fold hydrolase [Thermomicrobiales bacterium]